MNRESLDKFCERGILGLVLAILVFTPLAFGGVPQVPAGSRLDFILVNPFNIVLWLTVGVIVLWTVRLWATPRPKLLWPPICWAVLAFVVYTIIRYLHADIEYIARLEMIQVLTYGLLFLAIVNNLHRQESAQIITLTLVFLAMAISFYAIYQFFTSSDKVWCLIKPYPKRGTGTFISPNDLSGFLEMILPLGLACTLTSRMKALSKVFTGYASLAILVGIVVTVSRGSWFATAIALLAFFAILLFHHAHRLPALTLLLAIILAGMYFGPRDVFLRTRFRQIQSPQGTLDDEHRFALWHSAVQLWHENIWFGIGPGLFDYRFGKYRPAAVQVSPDRVHNDYLNTLTDYGIIGAALVAAAWFLLYFCALWTWRYVRGSPQTIGEHFSNKLTVVIGASAGLIAILVHSFVDFNMHIPANALVAVALMALLTCYLRFATDRYWFTARLGIKLPLTLALIAGLGYLGWQATRLGRQTVWLMRAQKSAPASAAQIDALQNAFTVEPKNFETARAIGEAYRLQSFQNAGDYEAQALEAMKWFKRAMELNPYDDSSALRYGICLDHIDRHAEAFGYFNKANLLDPNSYYDNAWMGWHYMQVGDDAAAIVWLRRSQQMESKDNPIADNYLQLAENQMLEAATNTTPFDLHPTRATEKFVPPPWTKN
ncbi:MAG TPA: O-antigen ligase family protein [Candidatus Polarisedimenticolia bacterium]|nr:O-antigen ligase family protein [Candidatus Polarisedimenticolia bacterium]